MPDYEYQKALERARDDYAAAKLKLEAHQQQIEAIERMIRLYRGVIVALSALLGEPDNLPSNENSTRRFSKRVK